MKIPSPSAKRKARIEIIPLIDIIFFLLATFVMLSLSMIKNHGITVALPGSTTSDHRTNAAATTISITARGALYFDKEPITLEQLPERLEALKRNHPEPVVILNGDRRASFGRSMAVLDALRNAQISQISIQTRPKDAGGAGP